MEKLCFDSLLVDYISYICFSAFKANEIKRLVCSHCLAQCRNYGPRRPCYDIYRRKIDNHDGNGELVECSICNKSVAVTRFAPHLEKCMGLGRQSRLKRNKAGNMENGPSLGNHTAVSQISSVTESIINVGGSSGASDAEETDKHGMERSEDTYQPRKRKKPQPTAHGDGTKANRARKPSSNALEPESHSKKEKHLKRPAS